MLWPNLPQLSEPMLLLLNAAQHAANLLRRAPGTVKLLDTAPHAVELLRRAIGAPYAVNLFRRARGARVVFLLNLLVAF